LFVFKCKKASDERKRTFIAFESSMMKQKKRKKLETPFLE
jgi:hypothetical protein